MYPRRRPALSLKIMGNDTYFTRTEDGADEMNRNEAKILVHSAFFRIVRTAAPTSINKFFKSTIKDRVPTGRTPSGWPGFWWESIAIEIQTSVMARREYIIKFDTKWLANNKSKKWSHLIDHMKTNLVPL